MRHSLYTCWLAAGSVSLVLAVASCGQPTKFDAAAFSDPQSIQKQADSYWKRDGWWGGIPKDVKKVAITQFTVEYVTENTSKSGADALSVLGAMEMAGMGKRKREFAEDFKRQFPAQLYRGFVDALKTEGIDAVSLEELGRNPAFAQLKAGQAGQTASFGDRTGSAKVQSYPVTGLPIVDNGFLGLGASDNIKSEYKLIGDTGAQAGLRVHMRVGLDDDGRAVLGGGSTIQVAYDFKKEQWSPNGPAEWVSHQRGSVVGGPSFRDDVPVINSKEFKAFQGDIYTVDTARYQESILKMYPTYARMSVIKLKS